MSRFETADGRQAIQQEIAERAALVAVSRTKRNAHNPPKGTHLVYRIYSNDGELLYVGATKAFRGRMRQHRSTGWWLREVDERRTEIETFDNAEDMARRELELIRNLRPPKNRAGVSSHAVPYGGTRVPSSRDGAIRKIIERGATVPELAAAT